MVNDPIADMLTRIRNGSMVKQKQVAMPSSKIKEGIARILVEEGFVEGYAVTDERPQPNLIVRLKYTAQGRPVISGLDRVSRK